MLKTNFILLMHCTVLIFSCKTRRSESQVKANDKCDFIPKAWRSQNAPPLMNGQLSPFWAQEYTGAILARDFVKSFPLDQLSIPKVGVVDLGFIPWDIDQNRLAEKLAKRMDKVNFSHSSGTYHGQSVAQIILGSSPLGFSEIGDLDIVSPLDDGRSADELMGNAAALMSQSADLINISMEMGGNGDVAYKAINDAAKNGKIFVLAIGNSFPFDASSNQKNTTAIRVGSLSPIGNASWFSNESTSIDILAPSDAYVLSVASKNDGKTLARFGGTSGAAPQVTGSIANVLALVPKLTIEDLKTLLKATALKTLNADERIQRNGAGTLNAYKLVRVAALMKQDKIHALAPDARRVAILQIAGQDFSKEFSDSAQLVEQELLDENIHCDRRKARYSEVQKRFLLSESPHMAHALSKFYRQLGYSVNSLFYDSFDRKSVPEVFDQALNIRDLPPSITGRNMNKVMRASIVKSMRFLDGPEYVKVWKKLLDSDVANLVEPVLNWKLPTCTAEEKTWAYSIPIFRCPALKNLGSSGATDQSIDLLTNAFKSDDTSVASTAADEAWAFGQAGFELIIEPALNHKSGYVRAAALKSLVRLDASRFKQIVPSYFDDNDVEVCAAFTQIFVDTQMQDLAESYAKIYKNKSFGFPERCYIPLQVLFGKKGIGNLISLISSPKSGGDTVIATLETGWKLGAGSENILKHAYNINQFKAYTAANAILYGDTGEEIWKSFLVLDETDTNVTRSAILSLKRIDESKAKSILENLKESKDWRIKLWLAQVAAAFKDKDYARSYIQAITLDAADKYLKEQSEALIRGLDSEILKLETGIIDLQKIWQIQWKD